MKKFCLVYILVVLMLSSGCAIFKPKKEAVPALEKMTLQQLHEKIDNVISKTDLKGGKIGFLVEDAENGEVIYDKNSKDFFKPASTNKLITTSSALFLLGKDYTYKTDLLTNGKIEGNVLKGDLVIKGTGDPSFSARYTENKDNVTEVFEKWADELIAKGILVIEGNIVGDDDCFDDEYYREAWGKKERGEWYMSEVSGLSFNDNCADLYIKSGENPGDPVTVSAKPETNYFTIDNKLKTIAGDGEESIDCSREDKSNKIVVSGEVPAGVSKRAWATIYNPTLYAATVLKETLQKKGVQVNGSAIDIDDVNDKAEYKTASESLAYYKSPELYVMVKLVNKVSHNFYADHICRKIGEAKKGLGSYDNATAAVQEFLKANNIWEEGHVMDDGSGLSRNNRVSPNMFVNLLKFIRASDNYDVFRFSLPIGATDGTIAARFNKDEKQKYLGKHILGKTGYIARVTSLAGYVINDSGRDIAFAFLVNDYDCTSKEVREMIDEVMLLVAEYNLTRDLN